MKRYVISIQFDLYSPPFHYRLVEGWNEQHAIMCYRDLFCEHNKEMLINCKEHND